MSPSLREKDVALTNCDLRRTMIILHFTRHRTCLHICRVFNNSFWSCLLDSVDVHVSSGVGTCYRYVRSQGRNRIRYVSFLMNHLYKPMALIIIFMVLAIVTSTRAKVYLTSSPKASGSKFLNYLYLRAGGTHFISCFQYYWRIGGYQSNFS